MSKYLAISLLIVIFILGLGIGLAITPEYASTMERERSGMKDLGNADRWLDLRYIDSMIAHHLSAIYLAEQGKVNSHRAEIRQLSQAIIDGDKTDIQKLYEYKKVWYGNSKQISRYEKVNLGDSDDTFDLRFLNALIAHHADAISLASEVQSKSTRSQVLSLADTSTQTLSSSSNQLAAWRKEWYAIE